jgi:hypothetical protein
LYRYNWVSGQPPVGYYNEKGEFVQGVYPGGVCNAAGEWACGYFTETGEFVEGFYNDSGEWMERQPRFGGRLGTFHTTLFAVKTPVDDSRYVCIQSVTRESM